MEAPAGIYFKANGEISHKANLVKVNENAIMEAT